MNILLKILFFCCAAANLQAAPKIEIWHTDNGIKTLFVAAPELPMIDVAVTFDAGSARDGEKHGISQLTHSLLNTGTGNLDADKIAEQFDDVGANFGASVNVDRSSVSLRSLTDENLFEQALTTYINVLTKPSFPKKDFERLKKQSLIAIKASEQRPGAIATKQFYKAIYGEHPYAHPSEGYRETIEALSLKEVKQFHEQYIVAENALIAIVGGIDLSRAKDIASRISSSLATGEKPNAIEKPKLLKTTKEIYVPYPSQQSHVFLGHLGTARGDPDHFVLYTGNHVLGGGGFTSRLMKEIRVQRGLSYSVYSYFYPLQLEGPFVLGLQTRTDQAEEALNVAVDTIKSFIVDGPTEEELTLSKKNIIGGFPLRIDSNRDILGYLSVIGYYDLPLNYLETFNDNIAAVTSKDIRNAFSDKLDIQHMVRVIVGGPEKN